MDHNYIKNLIVKMDNPELIHYASDYYDPSKAHEYYMKNRQLKGRKTGDLNEQGKDIWTDTKSNITEEKKNRIKEYQQQEQIDIQNLRTKAEQTRLEITNKLKALSEALNAKFKTAGDSLTKEQKDQLEVINRQREKEQKKIQEQKQEKIQEINKDSSLTPEEKQAQKAKLGEQFSKKSTDVKEKYSKETEQVRTDISAERQQNSSDKKTESTKNSEAAKTERTKVATDLKAAIQKARDTFTANKDSLDKSYEDIYQTEYDKIKSGNQQVKKAKGTGKSGGKTKKTKKSLEDYMTKK